MKVSVKLDQTSYHAFVHALKAESDGKALHRQLEREWRAIGTVAAADARRAIRYVPSHTSTHTVSLRAAIASGVKVEANTVLDPARKKWPGVAIVWHRSAMAKAVRGKKASPKSILWRAGQLFNRGSAWEHPFYGRGSYRQQPVAAKGWFDNSIEPHKPGMVEAVRQVYREMVDRIARRSTRI